MSWFQSPNKTWHNSEHIGSLAVSDSLFGIDHKLGYFVLADGSQISGAYLTSDAAQKDLDEFIGYMILGQRQPSFWMDKASKNAKDWLAKDAEAKATAVEAAHQKTCHVGKKHRFKILKKKANESVGSRFFIIDERRCCFKSSRLVLGSAVAVVESGELEFQDSTSSRSEQSGWRRHQQLDPKCQRHLHCPLEVWQCT
jgi:hypothetical protein